MWKISRNYKNLVNVPFVYLLDREQKLIVDDTGLFWLTLRAYCNEENVKKVPHILQAKDLLTFTMLFASMTYSHSQHTRLANKNVCAVAHLRREITDA